MKLKIVFSLICFLGASGCAPPDLPKAQTTDTLSLSSSVPTGIPGTGDFINYSQSPPTTVVFQFGSLPYTGTFSDFQHDKIGFTVTFTYVAPVTQVQFNFQLNSTSDSGIASPTFTSPDYTF